MSSCLYTKSLISGHIKFCNTLVSTCFPLFANNYGFSTSTYLEECYNA